MTTFDGAAGQWHVITADGAEDVIRVPWPGGEITERREVRRRDRRPLRRGVLRASASSRARTTERGHGRVRRPHSDICGNLQVS
ncbi:MAG: hypothetical protein R2692_01705 [Microbacterium sp.]